MTKNLTSLGLMSGTSGDGIDASVIIQMEKMIIRLFKTNMLNMKMTYIRKFMKLKKKLIFLKIY